MISGRTSAKRLIEKLQAQIERLRNFETPLQAAGVVVRDAAIMRFKTGGGDQQWAPSKKTQDRTVPPARKGGLPLTIAGHGQTGIDTGRLWQSIQVSPPDPSSVTIGTNVKYARWFQEGTGIFAGHTAWTIHPRNKKALSFDGFVVRSSTVPGQPPREFLVIGDSERSQIDRIFEAWIMQGALP